MNKIVFHPSGRISVYCESNSDVVVTKDEQGNQKFIFIKESGNDNNLTEMVKYKLVVTRRSEPGIPYGSTNFISVIKALRQHLMLGFSQSKHIAEQAEKSPYYGEMTRLKFKEFAKAMQDVGCAAEEVF